MHPPSFVGAPAHALQHRLLLQHVDATPRSSRPHAARRRAYRRMLDAARGRGVPRPLGAAGGACILWLRGADLRVRDAVALRAACSAHASVAPVYVLTGVEDASTLGALHATRRHLRALGSDLYVRRGAMVDALRAFAKSATARTVHTVAGVTARERRALRAADASLRTNGVELRSHWDGFLRAPDTLPFSAANAPTTADAFARRVARVDVPAPVPAPESMSAPVGMGAPGDLPPPPTSASKGHIGGEREAWRALDAYVRGRSLAAAGDAVDTTYGRLERYLRLGCISARDLHHALQSRLDSTSLKYHCSRMELELRDFFRARALSAQSKATPVGVARPAAV